MKTSKSVVKSGCFLKILGWRAQIFYWNEGAVSGVLRKNIFVADLLGTPYLFELLQSSLTFKNSENVVKVDISKNVCDKERQFFQNQGGI